jgi:hypothetical protein
MHLTMAMGRALAEASKDARATCLAYNSGKQCTTVMSSIPTTQFLLETSQGYSLLPKM